MVYIDSNRRNDDQFLLSQCLGEYVGKNQADSISCELLEQFGSLNELLNLTHEQIPIKNELAVPLVNLLRIGNKIAYQINRSKLNTRLKLGCTKTILEYCKSALLVSRTMNVRIFYLNDGDEILHDEIISYGTVDKVSVFPRIVISHCLQWSATKFLVIHTNPIAPSQAATQFIQVAKEVENAAKHMGISCTAYLFVSLDIVQEMLSGRKINPFFQNPISTS